VPAFDALEPRVVLSAAPAHSFAVVPLVQRDLAGRQPVVATIAGRVTNQATGRALNGVRVQLIDANGVVEANRVSGRGGQYRFNVFANGPYVVHLVAPRRFVQVTPTFTTSAPTGAYATNPATGQPYTGSSWSYHTGNSNPVNGPVGPPFWSAVAPAGNEPFQSPINITGAPIDLSSDLSIHYTDTVPKAIVNDGHEIEVSFASGGSNAVNLAGTTYNLTQFHFHDPSENQVDGQSYSMEVHFVNASASGATTVLAVFLQLGAHNNALDPILNAAMTSLESPDTTTTLAQAIHLAGLLPSSMMGWFYQGSLTTPPLSQPLNWMVFATPITLDYGQLKEYETIAHDSGFLPNARPTQPTDGRQVNEIDYDVNIQGQSVSGLDFTLSRTAPTAA
jgi:carbonic anhydrase